ncbi:bifunctional 2-C-methyl-D-erythritol 4-phosphate cytidylyltransferase/2-C-methyl-D-erythritol 2,4-cyclodiphosphate synthase [Roseibium sp.]|uniref:bifunctional 2-C-methyl-D-erythritol 4-phosphate cytidylyltransferase/2-C-methyl-D-erythritol 2,4-cyclodiphosphate synthase n=1 Tax=Roseibium sp. TaxID=1936156 RepID=UPI003BA9C0AB
MNKTAAALIVAAGRGTRLSDPDNRQPKQYKTIAGRPILSHTLDVFLNHPRIAKILTVIHADDTMLYGEAVAAARSGVDGKELMTAIGGDTRQQSVLAGLKALEGASCDYVLIHDAARPFVSETVIDGILARLDEGAEGVLAAVPVVDTLKRCGNADGRMQTVDRSSLWAAQTPQAFPFGAILAAHVNAAEDGRHDFTDDTGLAEWAGMTVELSDGDPANFKITTRQDLARAEGQVKQIPMKQETRTRPRLSELLDVRTGIGYDVHAFEPGEAIVLGGATIPHDRKLKGHSDADVVLHAITDATLGAIGDGDIGSHFPPSDPEWKGASSDRFQCDAIDRLTKLGGRLAHIDVTIVCEEPRIGPHRESIRQTIAEICDVPVSRVSVKATTSERLGFTGRREGIAALASVTVRLPLPEDE